MAEERLPWYVYLLVGIAMGGLILWGVSKAKTPQQTVALNEETWTFVRDESGRLKDIIVHREAR